MGFGLYEVPGPPIIPGPLTLPRRHALSTSFAEFHLPPAPSSAHLLAMLVFIVPLQSPQASSDWARVSALCERTLRSICGQTSADFRVFLVCNQAPRLAFSHPALTIVEDDFPIPQPNTAARMFDKHEKLKRGMIAARDLAPCHVMFVDADDLVNNRLAEFCAAHPAQPGWYIAQGYIHTAGSAWIYRWPDFDLICGTAAIVLCAEEDFPRRMSDKKSDFFMIDCGHFEFRHPARTRGRKLDPLPFPGAVYVTATGENDSGTSLRQWRGRKMFIKKLLNSRFVTPRLRARFGITCGDLASSV